MSGGKKRSWLWNSLGVVGFLAVSAAVVGGWTLLHKGRSEASGKRRGESQDVVVTAEPSAVRPLQRTVALVGTLYGRDEVAVSAKVEGRVVKIHHDVGDTVKPGDVLLEIDPTDFELAVAESRRSLELTLARLGLKQMPDKGFDVSTLPTVMRAAAQERNAATRLERTRRLASTGGLAAEDRDQAETEHKVALSNHRVAILEAEATLAEVRHRQAALDTALQRLKDTRIVVPGSSNDRTEFHVCDRKVSVGETAHVSSMNGVVFKLIVDHPLKLKVTVPERHHGEIQIGQKAELEVEAYPGKRFHGEVSRINPTVDRVSRTFQVEVLVPNSDRQLSAGSFAKVAILTRTQNATTVPEEAIVRFAGVTKIFVVRDGLAREVQVRTGLSVTVDDHGRTRTWIEVLGDLPVGAVVVTSGQTHLGVGTPVQLREGSER